MNAQAMGELAICLRDVSCKAGDNFELRIDRLRINAGERVAIVGRNGAGKSSLFRLLSGFVFAQQGSVKVLQHDLRAGMPTTRLRRLRCDVGQVLQGLHLVPRLSAIDNVILGCLGRFRGWRSWLGWYPQAELAAATEALQGVGMLAHRNTRTQALSGGERQKVAIARLLLQRPKLVLADEPTAALDPNATQEMCELMVQAAAGATWLCIVHNPALLPLLADRVIGLKAGRVAFDLPVASVDAACLNALYRLETPLAACHA